MKSIVYLSFVFAMMCCGHELKSQEIIAAKTMARLLEMGEMWGHVNYFHPYMQNKNISLDSAFAANVGAVIAAKTSEEYCKALNNWLSILNDKITFAEIKAIKKIETFDLQFEKKERIGIFKIKGSTDNWSEVMKVLSEYKDILKQYDDIIIDISQLKGELGWLLDYSGYGKALFKGNITTQGKKMIAYNGFVPETGTSSGGYSSYYKVYPSETLTGTSAQEKSIVFIASSESSIPELAYALRNAGHASIIGTDSFPDKENAVEIPLSEGIKCNLRLSESIGGKSGPDAVIPYPRALEVAEMFLLDKKFASNKGHEFVQNSTIKKSPEYLKTRYPDLGYRVLAASKIHYIINNFFPNKKLMGCDWDSVVNAYLPLIVNAKDSADYQMAITAMYAHINDGHGFIYGGRIYELMMGGSTPSPISGAMIEGRYIVTTIFDDSLASAMNIEIGDELISREGKSALQWMNQLKQHYAHSNEVAGDSYVSWLLCVGKDGSSAKVEVLKSDGKRIQTKLPFNSKWSMAMQQKGQGRNNTEVIRLISEHIGYVDLDRLESDQVDTMFELFKNTKAIIFDMRGYPHGTAWTIAPRLAKHKKTIAAMFTRLDRDSPVIRSEDGQIGSSETWTSFPQHLPPLAEDKNPYLGKTYMLINEHTQSQAEHTALFFQAANGTKLIGSQTAGANGDITNFKIPGRLVLNFSGQTVWFPDGRQLQRTGVVPDLLARPSINDIRTGKDSVLDKAIALAKKEME